MADGCTVLVVDDDRPFRETLATTLEAHGFCVMQAADGVEALQRLRAARRPTVVLLDLIMPRLDGAGFRRAQMADQDMATVPVIVCSGEIDVALRAERLGIRDFIRKPVDLERLLAVVCAHAGRSEPRPTTAPARPSGPSRANGRRISASPGSAR
jgi:CheY-like chemotaxis protein